MKRELTPDMLRAYFAGMNAPKAFADQVIDKIEKSKDLPPDRQPGLARGLRGLLAYLDQQEGAGG